MLSVRAVISTFQDMGAHCKAESGKRKAETFPPSRAARAGTTKPPGRVGLRRTRPRAFPLSASAAPLPFPWGCGIMAGVNPTVTQLTDQLIVSYAKVGGINHLDGK